MVGKMSLDLLNLETLKFLMLFRELGSSLYFIFISYILIYFFFSHFFSLYSLSQFFLIFSPFELSNCIVHTSSPILRRFLVLEQRGDRDKVGTGNTFPSERYLKSSILVPSIFLELMIHSQ
jgi:hypothetical protein